MTQDQPDEQQASRAPPDPMNLASIPDIMQRVFKKLEGQMTEEYRAILGVLERALVASDSSNATEKQSESETAAQTMDAITPSTDKTDPCVAAAAEIDRLCPNQTLGDSPGVEAFLTALWWMVFLTVRAVPFNHEGQHRLVRVVEALRLRAKSTVQVWGGEGRLWRDLPLFFQYLREEWVDPGICGDPDFYNDESVSEWVNLNVFVARLRGKGIFPDDTYAILEIQRGLEQEFPDTGLARQYTLRIASQWILQAGVQLLNGALSDDIVDEVELRITQTGPLFAALGGKPGLGMNRWRFWLKRLEDLGWEGGEDETRPERLEARQAYQHMKKITEQDSRVIVRRLGTNEEDEKATPAGEDSAPRDTENRE